MPEGTFQNMYQKQRSPAEGRDRMEFVEAEPAGHCRVTAAGNKREGFHKPAQKSPETPMNTEKSVENRKNRQR